MLNKQKIFLHALNYFSPEVAHKIALKFIKHSIVPQEKENTLTPNLETRIGSTKFSHPLGIAAGFDKNIETINSINKLEISHMEFGTITPKPQKGNIRPRVFRLLRDKAVINRLGFPNDGADLAEKKLSINNKKLPIGVNIGFNKSSSNPIEDYSIMTKKLGPYCEWLTINISSPNTPGIREFQKKEKLKKLLILLNNKRKKVEDKKNKKLQLWVKISPDLTESELKNIIDISIENKIEALCIANTTLSRPTHLISKNKKQDGGLSGSPLFNQSTKMLAKAFMHADKNIKFIGVGGISDGETAYSKILAGASLIQLYTGLIYNGPMILKNIINYLTLKCKRNQLSDLIGSNAKSIAKEKR